MTLWCHLATGLPVPNQVNVRSGDDVTGFLPGPRLVVTDTQVERRRVRKVRYLPERRAIRPDPELKTALAVQRETMRALTVDNEPTDAELVEFSPA